MPMSDEQERAVVEWLHKHRVRCRVCDGIDFTWFRDFLQHSKVIDTAGSISRENTLFVGLTCRQCGLFFEIEARVAGIPMKKQ